MKSINQLNAAVLENPTIKFSELLSAKYDRREYDYRNQYFNFISSYKEKIRFTPAGNFIFGAAMNEFYRMIESKGYNYHRDSKQIYFELDFCNKVLQFQVRATQGLKGVYLSIETNFEPLQNNRHQHSHKIRSNKTFAELDLKEYFEKTILRKHLFAPGLFQNIQIIQNCSKTEAIQFYKEVVKIHRKEEPDQNKAISHQIKRRLNVQVEDTFNNKVLLQYLKTEPRRQTRMKLIKHPSIFELSDQYCSQYDTDGNEETFLNEVYNDYPKNAIFI